MNTPTIERRNHGRGHSYYVNGHKYPGATTILQAYPKPALVGWAARAAADEVLDHWDELEQLTPSERHNRVRTAPDRDRDQAARRGTEVHRYAQQYLTGEDIDVPDELVGHVDAAIAFEKDWKVRELLVEAPVANVTLGYCGTIDLVADLADGHRWLLDLKTTRSGIFREVALQLAAYRYAEWVIDPNGTVTPMPTVDKVGAVWLQADRTYELLPVQADQQALAIFRAAKLVAHFADQKDDGRIGAPLTTPNGGTPNE